MLKYKAAYRFLDDGVHAEVVEFPASSPPARISKKPGDC